MNQLAIHKDDENFLLKTKNVLDEVVLDKYRTAGQITDTAMKYAINLINQMYHYKSQPVQPISEICLIVDSLMTKMLTRVYTKCERNISTPTSFNINEILTNYSPELDDQILSLQEGDIVTISLGVTIDGYVADASHTLVIYPPGEKPVGPLLGPKADAMVANFYCQEVVTALLGLSMTPEKIPLEIQQQFGSSVTGKVLKNAVNSIVEVFNCRVLPTSEIRVIRRFLSGQNEFLQEKGYKGIRWSEADQENSILRKLGVPRPEFDESEDDFTVLPGEVYQINLKIASIDEFSELGLITTEEVNKFTGLNNKESNFNTEPTIFVRDFIINYQLKLKGARSLLGKIDKEFSVYPFKLSHLSEGFPLKTNTGEEIAILKSKLIENKLGLAEVANHNLINAKQIKVLKFLPIKKILGEKAISYQDVNTLKLIKHEGLIKDKSIESTTVIINQNNNELVKISNNFKPNYCQSKYSLQNVIVDQLLTLLKDTKFGVRVKKVNALEIDNEIKMDMD